MTANPAYFNLGNPVTFRETPWLDLCIRAWGSEFQAPDHDIYKWSNGRGFDSTDRGLTGVYGVVGDNVLLLDGTQYPDMRDSIIIGVGSPNPGSANSGYGSAGELSQDPTL
jgi:hypothetical protein